MTTVKPNALLGAESALIKGMKLIRTLYESGDAYYGEDGSVLRNALKGGTRLLRIVHCCLCETIHEKGLDKDKASVKGMNHGNLDLFYHILDDAEISVRAAIRTPYLRSINDKFHEASIEQIRMAALMLEHAIDFVENPKRG